jgi:hypothetical protein
METSGELQSRDQELKTLLEVNVAVARAILSATNYLARWPRVLARSSRRTYLELSCRSKTTDCKVICSHHAALRVSALNQVFCRPLAQPATG